MDKIKDKIRKIIKLLDDKKAEERVILDLRKITTFTDYFIIATANSQTHSFSLAKEIMKYCKQEFKMIPLNFLKETDKSWILLDYQDFIVHLFIKEAREYYNLEELCYEAKKSVSI